MTKPTNGSLFRTVIRFAGKVGLIDTVTLWRPTSQAELDLVAGCGWRSWPGDLGGQPLVGREEATRTVRESLVPAEGVGYVTRVEVDPSDGRLAGVISEEADFRGPVGDDEFAEAEAMLGTPLPAAWRAYLQGGSWLHSGWLDKSGTYISLHSPREMIELHDAWRDTVASHPGIAIIGGDGSREQLVLDLRRDPAPVRLADLASEGWETTFQQTADVGELIARIEAGAFAIDFGSD
ncbi:SMI1/KNR4 family protein [Paractinoplanes brasiliensis]|uniref:Uncharacterized protein n=1 Tax=Paractinoplanes brasiliensis TaxID=52695 RepID=A0A4R6J8X5_9ACTN|nr:SMI1/KNR4 family protein [Actinoplanes brasiliensis]TDO32073.1 hypothetical protein C8E87_7515 [Actinoplanes brasiliensis]GID28120.1 hypothetical protein Abr02nite_31030 [Actinoplanes brasiliensis]